VLDVELQDGRTVQLIVNGDGSIDLRGWGNIPIKLGNDNRLNFRADLVFEPVPV
jgi:hypothetical protein